MLKKMKREFFSDGVLTWFLWGSIGAFVICVIALVYSVYRLVEQSCNLS